MEQRPLLSSSGTEKKGFSKTTLLVFISVILIIATFVGYNNGFIGRSSHSHVNSKSKLEDKLYDYKSFDITPELQPYEGVNIQLSQDVGKLKLETFTYSLIVGKLELNDKPQILEFVIDGYSKYISLQLFDKDSGDIISSFYTKKTLDTNTPDYYTINGKELDTTNEEAFIEGFMSFYKSDIPVSLAHLSHKIASSGYHGKVAKCITMLHGIAMHLVEIPEVSENIPSSFYLNKEVLNNFYEQRYRRRELEAESIKAYESATGQVSVGFNGEEVESVVSNNDNNNNIDDDYTDGCLFGIFCNGNRNCNTMFYDEECPEDCYKTGNCTVQNRCGNECLGTCGVNCDCVWFICGDCNCHCLCLNHDYYCSCVNRLSYQCMALWEWADNACD